MPRGSQATEYNLQHVGEKIKQIMEETFVNVIELHEFQRQEDSSKLNIQNPR